MRNRHQPCDEAIAAVVEMALLQHAQPGLLKQVFGEGVIASEMQQVAQKPVLILLDQRVEQIRVAAPETTRDLGLFGFHCNQRTEGGGDHTIGIYAPGREKDSLRLPVSDGETV